jgi:hypothetical protein
MDPEFASGGSDAEWPHNLLTGLSSALPEKDILGSMDMSLCGYQQVVDIDTYILPVGYLDMFVQRMVPHIGSSKVGCNEFQVFVAQPVDETTALSDAGNQLEHAAVLKQLSTFGDLLARFLNGFVAL